VLYDAVVLLLSAAGAQALARNPAARDFVTDTYAHCKFIGHVAQATDRPAKLLAYRRALFEVVRRHVA
jgi:hypothetical protein